jgi:hypothetical protein
MCHLRWIRETFVQTVRCVEVVEVDQRIKVACCTGMAMCGNGIGADEQKINFRVG